MRPALYPTLLLTVFALITACGDKLDPASPETEEPGDTAPVSDGNTVVTNPNVTNPNTTNPNAPVTQPTAQPAAKNVCGTTATTISYATHVGPLVNQRCGGCHGAGGQPPVMSNFSNTKSAFNSTNAKDQVDTGAMPQGGKLTANQICILDTWTATSYAP